MFIQLRLGPSTYLRVSPIPYDTMSWTTITIAIAIEMMLTKDAINAMARTILFKLPVTLGNVPTSPEHLGIRSRRRRRRRKRRRRRMKWG